MFAYARASIDSAVVHENRVESDDVLAVVAPGLVGLGFAVESAKTKAGKLPRPVSFGDEGAILRTYEIDAFQAEQGIALEVEAGRATMGNNIYRDLIQGSLMVDTRYLALAVRLSTGTGRGRRRSRATRRRTRSLRRSMEVPG